MTACCNLAMPIPRQKAAEAAAETTSAAISVQHLQMSFGTHQVLRDVDFTVRQGDVISIIGPSAEPACSIWVSTVRRNLLIMKSCGRLFPAPLIRIISLRWSWAVAASPRPPF